MNNKKWEISEPINKDFIDSHQGYSPVILQLLYNRGIKENEEIDFYLNASYENDALDPFIFKDMDKAVSLLIDHIKKKDKITVFGDYDADGVTSSVLLVEALRLLNAEVDYYIPDRVSEGYGLNMEAIKMIAADGTKLLLTCDTGIRNKDEIDYLNDKGINTIITDHHQAPENEDDYPNCLIINPALPRESDFNTKLAGVGVALKFIEALISRSKLEDIMKERLLAQFFDLAAIGTIADCVPLQGDNRLIVKKGLREMLKTKRIGLKELIKVSGIKDGTTIDSWNVGFQLAPRINAAGRMNHANTAFNLLLSRDKLEAAKLAGELNFNNQMRQKSTEKIFTSVEKQLMGKESEALLAAVYEYEAGEEHEPWNEGIIGLVSGRVTERYYRPSLIITKSEHGYKGSGRSIPEFDLSKALEKSKDHLAKYGGHPLACGFSLSADDLEAFLDKVKGIADNAIGNMELVPLIKIDTKLDLAELDIDLAWELKKLCPFGQNNPQPVFLTQDVQVIDKINMGIEGQHLKLRIKNQHSNILSAIGFGQSKKWQDINIGDTIDIVYNLDINEFNGKTEVQLRIIDIKQHG